MSIKEQWQAAKNEFGEQAFNRFDSGAFVLNSNAVIENIFSVVLHDDKDDNNDYLWLKPLPELYAHDDSYYIDAFLMWQWRYADGSNDWTDCNKPLSFKTDKEYRRKESAGLSFDSERAKAVNVMELYDGEKWRVPNKIIFNDAYNAIEIIHNISARKDDLRMKYPQRRQNEK